MNLNLLFALRYLFQRKPNLINIISFISMAGIAGMTAALVVILSVFNGFDVVIASMINKFDPDIKVEAKIGKTFISDSLKKQQILNLSGVKSVVETVEETALFQYNDRQYTARLKGVDSCYSSVSNLKQQIVMGKYELCDKDSQPRALLGAGVAVSLGVGSVNNYTYLKLLVPQRSETVSLNPDEAFRKGIILPGGVFDIHNDFDYKYVIVPESFASALLGFETNEVSSFEIAVNDYSKVDQTVNEIQSILGNDFSVKNRYRQQELLYKIMKSEKFAIFIMLAFILVIASFNIIGALTMLVIDKKQDIVTLYHLGADTSFIKKIFLMCGRLITLTGTLLGLILGIGLSLLQKYFGLLRFPDGSFVIDYYPVDIRLADILLVTITVLVIGFTACLYPVSKIKE